MTIEQKHHQFQQFLSNKDSKRYLPAFWEHGPFPESLSKKLDLLDSSKKIYLSSGVPNKELFSIKNISVNHTLDLGYENVGVPGDHVLTNTFHIGDESFSKHLSTKDKDYNSNVPIESVFEYADQTYGLTSTIELFNKLVTKFNYFREDMLDNKQRKFNYETIITSGTSASCFYLTQLLLDKDKTILIEEFTYPVIIANITMTDGHFAPFNLNMHATEANGENPIDVEYLNNLLSNWDSFHPNKPYPTCLYTIPVQNPTGLVQSSKHRQEVYDICKKHNVLIIEDDPYGNILLTDEVNKVENNTTSPHNAFINQRNDYLKKLESAASYLSIDTEGIVFRCESVSKVFAPGLRVGVIIANKFFIDRLKNIIECTTREISGPSMTMFNSSCYGMDVLLKRQLQVDNIDHLDGWIQWLMNLSHRYKLRQDILLQSLYNTRAYKEKKLFECIEPKFGMFLCIQLNLEKLKPAALESSMNMRKCMQYMDYKLLEHNLSAIVGTKLSIDVEHSYKKSGFIRVTVAQATGKEQLELAAHELGRAIEEFFDEYLTPLQAYEVLL